MRRRGYLAAVVERWNPYAKIRQDLFGFVDIIAIGKREVIAVQCTSGSHVANRVRKIADHENLAAVRKGGIRILVHGWSKRGRHWSLREVDVS
jgi:hypothetical protein